MEVSTVFEANRIERAGASAGRVVNAPNEKLWSKRASGRIALVHGQAPSIAKVVQSNGVMGRGGEQAAHHDYTKYEQHFLHRFFLLEGVPAGKSYWNPGGIRVSTALVRSG